MASFNGIPQATLSAALGFILEGEFEDHTANIVAKFKQDAAKDFGAEPWKTLSERAIGKARDQAIINLQLTIPATINEAIAYISDKANHITLFTTKDQATNNPNQGNDLRNVKNENHRVLFDTCIYATASWQKLEVQAPDSEFEKLKTACNTVLKDTIKWADYANSVVTRLAFEHGECGKAISVVQGLLLVIQADTVLSQPLSDAVAAGNLEIARARQVLVDNSVALCQQQFESLAAPDGKPLASLNTGDIDTFGSALHDNVFWTRKAFTSQKPNSPMLRFDINTYSKLKAALIGGSYSGWMVPFANRYGAAAAYALAPIESAKTRTFLELFSGDKSGLFVNAWQLNVPQGSDVGIIRGCIEAALAKVRPGKLAEDRDKATQAIGDFVKNTGRVDLPAQPANVNVLQWKLIDAAGGTKVWFPVVFAIGNLTTDDACIKHLDETGISPPLARLNAYFAEMAGACVAAKAQWTASGKLPGGQSFQVQKQQATWKIGIKPSVTGPLVYHVDSGYENSPWMQ